MRLVLAFAAVLASSTAATAQVVQDRYGPPRAVASAAAPGTRTAALGAPYGGRMLNWTGRLQAPVEAARPAPPPAPATVVRPRPAEPGDNLYATPAAPPPRAEPPAPPRQPVALRRLAPPPPRSVAVQPPPAPPRDSRDAAPEPSPVAAPARADAPIEPQRPLVRAEPAPRQAATAPAAPTPPPVAQRPGQAPPRLYSLHRQYGMTPDLIPPQPSAPRYVLIGPPDETDDKSKPAEKKSPAGDGDGSPS